MFRIFFVMVTTMLVGLGSGYFLWGSRVARLTESLSGLTLELDTMRAKLAAPVQLQNQDGGGAKAADELRVINESIASMRQELAEQKALVEKTVASASPGDAAAANAQLLTVRQQLSECMADKADLEQRRSAGAAAQAPGPGQPGYVPAYQPPRQAYQPRQQPVPADEIPDYEAPPGR